MGGRTKVEDRPAAIVEGRSYAESGSDVARSWQTGEEEDGFVRDGLLTEGAHFGCGMGGSGEGED